MSRHRKVCYLSGKMRGLPGRGFDLFEAGAKLLTQKGWRCISPAALDTQLGFDPHIERDDIEQFDRERFRHDFTVLLTADAIALLPNWQHSRGARAELLVARMIGLPVYEVDLANQTVTRVRGGLGSREYAY